ncbi:MAG: aspartate carbamoyltransferase, partial [Vulcanimicrobiaceae bacterium]
DYARNYRLDGRRLRLLRKGAIVMHPGPYNRGAELTEEVLAFPGWRYAQQVSHGVRIRMAVLDHFMATEAGIRCPERSRTRAFETGS